MVMYYPVEGLKNYDVINRAKKSIDVSEKVLNVFANAMFAKHPNGMYWRRDMAYPFLTNKRSEGVIVRPADVVEDPAVLNESNSRTRKVEIKNVLKHLDQEWTINERRVSPQQKRQNNISN